MSDPVAQTGWLAEVELATPSLADNTADGDRLRVALEEVLGEAVGIPLDLLRELPAVLRGSGYRVRCGLARDRDRCWLAGLVGADGPDRLIGAAIDLGTTRIVVRLVDLSDGAALGEWSFDNPQAEIGPDILVRIHHAEQDGGLERLQGLVAGGLNQTLAAACREIDLTTEQLVLLAVAGNTAMTHLLLGLPPRWIVREPYTPVVNAPDTVLASTLGLQAGPGARLFAFPNVGSYFGGDLIAGIIQAGMDQRDDAAILVDVGTNAEVVLGNKDWLIACAGAAGPALEAGVADIGMLAGEGVIDKVWWDEQAGDLRYRVIGAGRPKGICGSGLIDLAAALFTGGVIDLRGQLIPSACPQRCRTIGDSAELVLVPAGESATGRDLVLDQRALTSLKKAKAAMFTILETLTASVGQALEEVSGFCVAGTFGSVIDPESAITIGMLPDLPRDRFRVLGNSSLGGATRLLQDASLIERIFAVRDRITYMELNVNQDFMNRFSGAQFFPHTDPTRFPSVKPAVGRASTAK